MTTRPFDLRAARAMRDGLDPYYAVLVFSPAAVGVFGSLGLDPWSAYFAGRAAPLGEASEGLVEAVFFHFEPGMVAANTAKVRAAGVPEKLLAVRLDAADAALRDTLGAEALDSAEMAEAAELAAEAAAACTSAGRPLGAANATLPLPEAPHLKLWQAVTTLREWRGDGHNTALLASGLDAVEVLVNAVATGHERRSSIQPRRGWSDAEWEAAEQRLHDRHLLTEDGGLTLRGRELREEIEDLTDRLALAPWRALGEPRTRRLYDLVLPWSTAIAERFLRGYQPEPYPTA
ncbi:hypothetical protein DN069_15050 [Streptacidiphilus pinicola]|uniref:SalK n=1 Tax=Streptacidiphilus pinicola TaxID=2219663 RepID=A0A2X0II46_9ACTN|nr:hypothetical protein [Streptacidiphilus pinicola]RAG84754.1 hypothetical protein DN069_15050 [Streptacidiphilus pinicola]